MKLIVTDKNNITQELEGIEGWRVMEILRDYGFPVAGDCEGNCCCGTCHVYVAKEWLDKLYAISPEEQDQLDTLGGVKPTSRLSCQIILESALDGLAVTLPKQASED